MQKRVLGFVGIAVVAVLALGFAYISSAKAEESKQGLEISPPVGDYSANPGQTLNIALKVRNITDNDLTVKTKISDFKAKDEEGNADVLPEGQDNGAYSIKNWITKIPDFSIAPKELKTIQVNVRVPDKADPGGHYGAITFTPVATSSLSSGSGVVVSASVNSLVLVRVGGSAKESLSFEDFFTADQKKNRTRIFQSPDITFISRLRNSGTVHLQPAGNIEVFDIFGRRIATLTVNETNRKILPASIRRFENQLKKKFLFGYYKARETVVYGNDKNTVSKTISFFVIPWKLIIIVLLSLVALFFILRFAIRKYNAMIIRKHGKW